ncbi:MAG: helix-turn-helix domain-containing protein [Methylocystis sp.]|uniref:helix-turn-helix domain-containing protein n=1 Tax=Methylocystis sp. TaxID=1911079 RepID=UPI003DA1EC12
MAQNSYRCKLLVTGEQLRGARAMVRLEQSDLAKTAGVSVDTIKRLERTQGVVSANLATVHAIVAALEAAGVVFLDAGESADGGPGVRLKAVQEPAPDLGSADGQ